MYENYQFLYDRKKNKISSLNCVKENSLIKIKFFPDPKKHICTLVYHLLKNELV